MDASRLTPRQGEKLADTVGPMLGYVYRLACRMERMGWKPDDPLYVAAWQSYYALHDLHVHARYASCTPGTGGRPPGSSRVELRSGGGGRVDSGTLQQWRYWWTYRTSFTMP